MTDFSALRKGGDIPSVEHSNSEFDFDEDPTSKILDKRSFPTISSRVPSPFIIFLIVTAAVVVLSILLISSATLLIKRRKGRYAAQKLNKREQEIDVLPLSRSQPQSLGSSQIEVREESYGSIKLANIDAALGNRGLTVPLPLLPRVDEYSDGASSIAQMGSTASTSGTGSRVVSVSLANVEDTYVHHNNSSINVNNALSTTSGSETATSSISESSTPLPKRLSFTPSQISSTRATRGSRVSRSSVQEQTHPSGEAQIQTQAHVRRSITSTLASGSTATTLPNYRDTYNTQSSWDTPPSYRDTASSPIDRDQNQ